jgi:hypothetical protein
MAQTQVPQSVTVTLTDAQIKALPTSAVEVIPAPGAGKYIVVLNTFVALNTSAGAYGNLSGATCKLFLNYSVAEDPITQPADENSDLFFGTAAVSYTPLATIGSNNAWSFIMNNLVNDAVELGLDNAGAGALTGGNAANTMTVTVVYIVIDV